MSVDVSKKMGKKFNLGHLNEEECEQILKVIQRDFELREKEKQRLAKVQADIDEAEGRSSLLTNSKFNENSCIHCFSQFRFLLNPKVECSHCKRFLCKNCIDWIEEEKKKVSVCLICQKTLELQLQSNTWFYKNIRERFKRFGSAKVVRSLFKRKSNETDDADEFPDVQDGFSSEPTGRQPRAGLEQLFEINIHDQAAGQAPNRSDSDSATGEALSEYKRRLEVIENNIQLLFQHSVGDGSTASGRIDNSELDKEVHKVNAVLTELVHDLTSHLNADELPDLENNGAAVDSREEISKQVLCQCLQHLCKNSTSQDPSNDDEDSIFPLSVDSDQLTLEAYIQRVSAEYVQKVSSDLTSRETRLYAAEENAMRTDFAKLSNKATMSQIGQLMSDSELEEFQVTDMSEAESSGRNAQWRSSPRSSFSQLSSTNNSVDERSSKPQDSPYSNRNGHWQDEQYNGDLNEDINIDEVDHLRYTPGRWEHSQTVNTLRGDVDLELTCAKSKPEGPWTLAGRAPIILQQLVVSSPYDSFRHEDDGDNLVSRGSQEFDDLEDVDVHRFNAHGQAAMSGRSSVNDVRKDTTIDDERPISERSDSLADVSLQTELSEVAGAGSAAWGGSGDRNKMGNQGVYLDADESCSSTDVEEGEPRFLRPPRDMTVEQGETLRNDCRLSGTRPIDVFWYRDAMQLIQLDHDDRCSVSHRGHTYSIDMVDLQTTDEGHYLCIGVNEFGHCRHTFNVYVNDSTASSDVIRPSSVDVYRLAKVDQQPLSTESSTSINSTKNIQRFSDQDKNEKGLKGEARLTESRHQDISEQDIENQSAQEANLEMTRAVETIVTQVICAAEASLASSDGVVKRDSMELLGQEVEQDPLTSKRFRTSITVRAQRELSEQDFEEQSTHVISSKLQMSSNLAVEPQDSGVFSEEANLDMVSAAKTIVTKVICVAETSLASSNAATQSGKKSEYGYFPDAAVKTLGSASYSRAEYDSMEQNDKRKRGKEIGQERDVDEFSTLSNYDIQLDTITSRSLLFDTSNSKEFPQTLPSEINNTTGEEEELQLTYAQFEALYEARILTRSKASTRGLSSAELQRIKTFLATLPDNNSESDERFGEVRHVPLVHDYSLQGDELASRKLAYTRDYVSGANKRTNFASKSFPNGDTSRLSESGSLPDSMPPDFKGTPPTRDKVNGTPTFSKNVNEVQLSSPRENHFYNSLDSPTTIRPAQPVSDLPAEMEFKFSESREKFSSPVRANESPVLARARRTSSQSTSSSVSDVFEQEVGGYSSSCSGQDLETIPLPSVRSLMARYDLQPDSSFVRVHSLTARTRPNSAIPHPISGTSRTRGHNETLPDNRLNIVRTFSATGQVEERTRAAATPLAKVTSLPSPIKKSNEPKPEEKLYALDKFKTKTTIASLPVASFVPLYPLPVNSSHYDRVVQGAEGGVREVLKSKYSTRNSSVGGSQDKNINANRAVDPRFRSGIHTLKKTSSQVTNDSGFGSPGFGSRELTFGSQTSKDDTQHRTGDDAGIANQIESSKVKRVDDTRYPTGDLAVKIRPFSARASNKSSPLADDDFGF